MVSCLRWSSTGKLKIAIKMEPISRTASLWQWVKDVPTGLALWGLNSEDHDELRRLRKEFRSHLASWTIFTVFLPLVTFGFAVLINVLYFEPKKLSAEWGKMFNNGSLPIIAFGIISSSLPFIVDKLTRQDKQKEDVMYALRKRVLGIATIVMFIASGLFIIQSLSALSNNSFRHQILLGFSVLITIWASTLGRIMFLTQSATPEPLPDNVKRKSEAMTSSLSQQFAGQYGVDDE